MKLREHRGSLAESIATSIEIPNTIEAVAEAIRNSIQSSDVEVTNDTVHVGWYAIDERMDPPEVWIVTVDGYGVYGFTDSELVA